MAARNPRSRELSSGIANRSRHHGKDDPHLAELRRDLQAERQKDLIRQIVDQAPPLTAAQRDNLATLMRAAADELQAAS
jgi:hypothetical protein